ncbi:MAG TPA: sigma-70 family RNA polymerase sigma factor [Streptosporangiaceae bacterium]|nr:sigma-70 family RNA polymerase sigma factor [Streptosporangiaceae bacterium]
MRHFITMAQHAPAQRTGQTAAARRWEAPTRSQTADPGQAASEHGAGAPTGDPCRHLLARAQSGDRDALEELCRENWLLVYRAVSRWASTQSEAEDLTQDVFVRAIQSLSSVRSEPPVPYRAYLLRIARNLVIDRWRAREPGTTSLHLLERSLSQSEDLAIGPEATVVSRDEHQRLLDAIDRLPDAYSDVLRQRILLSRTAAEVGARTGRTANAIRQLQFRAMAALRRELAAAAIEEDR